MLLFPFLPNRYNNSIELNRAVSMLPHVSVTFRMVSKSMKYTVHLQILKIDKENFNRI